MYVYNFPETVFVPHGRRERGQQVQHVVSEALEAKAAIEEGERRYVMELLDTVHAAETALREFDKSLVDECAELVHDKNSVRGYYGEPRVMMGGARC